MLLWLSDPLLSLLLIEAILVRRSVIRMGQGLVAKCWGMFVLAIVVTSAGDAAIWASSHNLLSESITALSWYIWFVAAAAFASAPAYQLAAISLTRGTSTHLMGK
jgi:TRAP-type mannitol/chloroaromatic compound transport system permease small subunit